MYHFYLCKVCILFFVAVVVSDRSWIIFCMFLVSIVYIFILGGRVCVVCIIRAVSPECCEERSEGDLFQSLTYSLAYSLNPLPGFDWLSRSILRPSMMLMMATKKERRTPSSRHTSTGPGSKLHRCWWTASQRYGRRSQENVGSVAAAVAAKWVHDDHTAVGSSVHGYECGYDCVGSRSPTLTRIQQFLMRYVPTQSTVVPQWTHHVIS